LQGASETTRNKMLNQQMYALLGTKYIYFYLLKARGAGFVYQQ
jgi:hypothetical protein